MKTMYHVVKLLAFGSAFTLIVLLVVMFPSMIEEGNNDAVVLTIILLPCLYLFCGCFSAKELLHSMKELINKL